VRDCIILIETTGAVVGQVNGLAVIDFGDFAFGRPSRITARTGIVDIEREAGFGGRSHNKGVLIPQANIDQMMLREDVVAAVAEDRVHIWPVETIDEGLAILTGLEPGEAGPDGSYPPGTLNRRGDDRLGELARLLSDFEAKKPEADKPATGRSRAARRR